MNISAISAPYFSSAIESRPVDLATVGRDSIAPSVLSSRPVPSIDESSASAPQSSNNASPLAVNTAANTEQSVENQKQNELEARELEQEQSQISELAARDREVRAHEQAHAAVGGQYAGAPKYQFERGPDGVNYAVGGEVSIDVSSASTPQETIQKMQTVRRAALAPAEPSPQDRQVAAQAALALAQAVKELASENTSESQASSNTDEGDSRSVDDAIRSEPLRPSDGSSPNVSNDTALPPNAISSQLNRSISAASLSSRSGSLFDQLA